MSHKLAVLFAAVFLASSHAAVYQVSPTGSDSASGSSTQPFRTLAKASGVLAAGDTCLVHAGTYYYDYIRPAASGTVSSPIVFISVGDGEAMIHGGEKITGWVKDSGLIYKATIATSRTVKELFVNRRHMLWARFPNMPYNPATGFDMFHPKFGTASPPAGVNWNGVISIIDEGTGWVNRITRPNAYVYNTTGILVGVKGLLDAEGEWYQSGTTVWFRPPGNVDPNTLLIEYQTREFCVDLSSRSYIIVRGLTVFGSSISMQKANNCEVTDCKVFYPCPLFLTSAVRSGGWIRDDSGAAYGGVGKGVTVGGSNNKFAHSEVAHSWGDGVTVYGTSNDISDCYIYDCDWSKTDAAGVTTGGRGNIVEHNTLHHFARSGVNVRKTAALMLRYNDVHHSGIMSHDLGPVYCGWIGPSVEGTTIAYNWLHDDQSSGNGARGVYLDPETFHFLVHHNVIWSLMPGNATAAMGTGTANNSFFNNSCFSTQGVAYGAVETDATLKFDNNIIESNMPYSPSTFIADVRGNFGGAYKALYRDPAHYDWRLRPRSPCIDTGVVLSGITDGYLGKAPEAGAYEYGAPRWEAGVGTGPDYAAIPMITPERRHEVPCQGAMTSATSGAQIRYTIDGSEPTAASMLYGQPFTLNAATTIKAKAFKTGLRPSRTASALFTARRNAFTKIEAESADAWYLARADSSGGRSYLTAFRNNEWVLYESVDFGTGATSMDIEYFGARAFELDTMVFRIDDYDGEKIASFRPPKTDSVYQTATIPLWRTVSGIHDLHVTVTTLATVNRLDWFRFSGSGNFVKNPIGSNSLASSKVCLTVYDLKGRRVAEIRNIPYASAMATISRMKPKFAPGAHVMFMDIEGKGSVKRRIVY